MKLNKINITALSRRLKTGLLALALMPAATAVLQSQTTSTWTNATANLDWGNAINWSPNGIPNGTDAIVVLTSTAILCTNSPENISAAGAFPYVFGTLKLNGGSIGNSSSSATLAANQLRAAVSSGAPVIDCAGGLFYGTLVSKQGIYIANSSQNQSKILEFRYNTATMLVTGLVEIASYATLEQNADYSLGNPTNILQIDDNGTWSSRASTSKDFTPATRQVLLNSATQPALIGTYSTYPWTIAASIGEITPGSSLEMPPTIAGSTTYGAGVITLTATNTFTGAMILTHGTLNISNQFALQSCTLTPNTGGTLLFDKGITGNAFAAGGLAGNGYLVMTNTATPGVPITLTVGGNNADTTYSGRLLGVASGGTLVKVGTGTLTLAGTADNSYGTINASNGTVVLGKSSTASVHANGGGVILNGGTVQLGGTGADQINNAVVVTINSGVFDLAGHTETIGGLNGNGGTNTDSSGGAGTLTVNAASGASVTNSSVIAGGNLVFGGPGTQVFAGTDIRDALYPGMTTTVNGGTFQLGVGGGVIPMGGNTGITVNSAGTLALNFSGTFTNSIAGSGNVAVNSPGTVIIAGSDTHTGKTLVNTGTLALPGGGVTVGGSVITIASNATFNVTGGAGAFTLNNGQTLNGRGTVTGNYATASGATNAGNLTFNGNLTLQSGAVLNPGSPTSAGTITNNGSIINAGGYTLIYNLAATFTPGGGTNGLLVVSGNLNLGSTSGGNAVSLIINGTPANGTYVLATFGTFSGTVADVAITGVSGGQTYTLQTSGNQLQLVVGGQSAQSLVWRGDGSANVWDANNGANLVWFDTASNTVVNFNQSDLVTFDDSSVNGTVNLTGNLLPQPGSVVTVNSTNNYTFTGSGSIGNSVTLTKTNTGTLTIDTGNTFTGPVNLNGGVISVPTVAANGAASPLGEGNTLAINGGTFQYTGPNANGSVFNRAVSIGTNGATIDQSGSGYLYIGGLISGSGPLTKIGASQLVISGNNAGYTNLITYVNDGQLQLRNANALGTNSSLVIVTNTGVSVAVAGGVTGTVPKAFTLNGDGNGGGALQANDTGTSTTFSGAINLMTNASYAGASFGGNGTGIVSGVISGPGTLTKLGTGTLKLANNNTYTGGTVVSAGTLQLGTGAGNGTNGWFAPLPVGGVLTDNGCLAINHTNDVSLTDTVSGTGWINQIGTGTLTLGGSNDFWGGNVFSYASIGYSMLASVNVNNGILLVTNAYALGVGAVVGGNGVCKLQLAGNVNIPAPMVLWSGGPILENLSGTNSLLGEIEGVYGGGWSINAASGLLTIATFNNRVYNGGNRTLQITGPANGIITNIIDTSSALMGQAGNFLQLQKDGTGTWTIAGAADVTRLLTVNAGALVIDGNGAINAGGSSQLYGCTVAGGKFIVNGAVALSAGATANVNGGQLGGNGTITGPVSINSGGTLAPTAGFSTNTSTLTITGNLTLLGNALIAVNKSLGQSNDLVNVGGLLSNVGNGIVTVTNNGAALVAGDTFTLFNQPVTGGAALNLNRIVRGALSQYVTWTNNLAVNGSLTVLSAAPLGTNANLVSLALNPADNLTPTFAPNAFVYYATNAAGVMPTVTVTNSDLTASNALMVNGAFSQVLTSGVPSLAITNLGAGATNVLKVLVTAQDTVTTNLYTVNLTQLVSTVNTNTFTIGSSVSEGNLNLTWPPDRLGWKLWVQTNSLNAGLGTNWYAWPNSTTVTNVSIPLNPANPSVFLRMTYP